MPRMSEVLHVSNGVNTDVLYLPSESPPPPQKIQMQPLRDTLMQAEPRATAAANASVTATRTAAGCVERYSRPYVDIARVWAQEVVAMPPCQRVPGARAGSDYSAVGSPSQSRVMAHVD